MQPTAFWYSAYPDLTAEQIRANTLIRDGLSRISTPSDAEAWIDLFGSIPRPAFSLQAEKIQSMVFGGSGNLKVGRCLAIKSDVTDGIDPAFQEWVHKVNGDITFGDGPPQNQAIYIGFTARGLALLGCDDDLEQSPEGTDDTAPECTKFPPAFSLGMDSNSRRKILGDIAGKNASSEWKWGSDGEFPTHAVLLIYGHETVEDKEDEKVQNLDAILADQKKKLAQFGLKYKEIKFKPLPESGFPKEPFGFADGISQPLIKGTKQAKGRDDSIHLVSPGEFVLGYKDNRDYYPPSPQVDAKLDTDNTLPAIPRAQPQRYPRFQSHSDEKFRDLGRNGSYLVIRQLEQDVPAFKAAVEKAAAKFECERPDLAVDMIKAKLMGRWPDGQPLTKKPVHIVRTKTGLRLESPAKSRPLTRADNEFLLGEEDPQGFKCPYGSHIRRSNPRDGLDVENPEALEIVNRHRILRRGRGYEETDKSGNPVEEGILFMCLNSDIERQFEFIQQTWIGSCKFHGLNDEMDPIAGQGFQHIHPGTKKPVYKTKGLGFTIQDPVRSERLRSFKAFVTMRGGGYFFMPGKEALDFMASRFKNKAR